MQGLVAAAQNQPRVALDFLSKALQAHPDSSASVRTAVAALLFKLEQYDRAAAALNKAGSMEVNQVLVIYFDYLLIYC
jgi:predicted Zn-dependent protease